MRKFSKQIEYKININFKSIKLYRKLISFIFIMIYLPIYLSKNNILDIRKLNSFSQINITIEGIGDQSILNKDAVIEPDEIYINGVPQDEVGKKVYNLNLIENIITLRWNNPVIDCYKMFSELSNITKIDFSEFDTSYVINMSRMFSGCIRLTSLDLSNFITSKVIVMNGMFQESGLISLNLSNFDTSSVINMNGMFYSCKSIISVNLKNFDTSLVTNFHSMFQECNSLKYLDLSSFRTPSLLDIGNMFQNCYSLISVNLDNFDTSKVTSMSVMFYGCSSLVSLNLNSFNTSSLGYIHSVFENVNNNIAFCADNLKLSESSKFTINCEDLCFTSETKKFIVEKRQCILHCTNDDKYIFEYDNRCYESCPNETHITSDNKFLCRKNPKGYYLDKENDIYKPCYSTCEICKGEGNEHEHNCILCKLNYILLLNPENIYNCYKECDYYFYFNSLGEYKCTVNNECPNEYSKLIELKRKCVDNCTNDDTFIQ